MSEEAYRLREWVVQPRRNTVRRGRRVVHLKPKTMAVLARLIESGGDVVTRDALFDAVWPGIVVSDATLTQCVVELRRALGDSARRPRYIETVPKVGFRLVAPIETIPEHPVGDGEPVPSTIRVGSRWQTFGWVLLVALFVIALAWRFVPVPMLPSTDPNVTTLAVLPFEDLGADRESLGLAPGLTEELIARLSRLQGLRVTGRTSSLTFEHTDQDPESIARALGVTYLLDGSVRESGEQLRITARLIDPYDGFTLWAEVFERPAEDYFTVQQEIAESVATALSISLEVGELGRIPGGTTNYRVYRKVREAWASWDQMTIASALVAIELLKSAITEDPQCAVCWFDLAMVSTLTVNIHGGGPPELNLANLASEALDEARHLEPRMPGLLTMQFGIEVAEFDWIGAEAVVNQAGDELKADPGWKFTYGNFKIKVGHLQDASESIRQSRLVEPLDPHVATLHAHLQLLTNRTAEALTEYERARKLERTNHKLNSSMATTAALATGDPSVIRPWLQRLREASDPLSQPFLRGLEETLEDSPAALAFLQDAFDRRESSDYWIAEWAAYHGDTDLAFRAVERARGIWAVWSPLMKPLRQHPEFQNLLEEWGLIDYWQTFGWGDFCRPLGSDRIVCE